MTPKCRIELLGLDEGAPDVVVADEAELEGQPRLLGVADGGEDAAVGDRRDEVGVGGSLARELGAQALAHLGDGVAEDDAVGAREVDVLEDAARAARDLRQVVASRARPRRATTTSPGSSSRTVVAPMRSKAHALGGEARVLAV